MDALKQTGKDLQPSHQRRELEFWPLLLGEGAADKPLVEL